MKIVAKWKITRPTGTKRQVIINIVFSKENEYARLRPYLIVENHIKKYLFCIVMKNCIFETPSSVNGGNRVKYQMKH